MSNSISYVIETHGLAKAYKIEEPALVVDAILELANEIRSR